MKQAKTPTVRSWEVYGYFDRFLKSGINLFFNFNEGKSGYFLHFVPKMIYNFTNTIMGFETPTPEYKRFLEQNTGSHVAEIRDFFQKNYPELFKKIFDTEIPIQESADGKIIESDGEAYSDTPRTRELIRISTLIRSNLPPVANNYVRLWRGFETESHLIEEIYAKVHYYNYERRHTAHRVPPMTFAKSFM